MQFRHPPTFDEVADYFMVSIPIGAIQTAQFRIEMRGDLLRVSIPIGAIQTGVAGRAGVFRHVSIPIGAIQTAYRRSRDAGSG